MAAPAEKQLLQLQRRLYDQAFQQAHASTTGGSIILQTYARKFEKSLPQSFKKSDLNSLLRVIRQNQVILYGDFHTHKQSQRGLLRILRSFKQRFPDQKIHLMLETFKFNDQKHLDAFYNNEIDDDDLLTKTHYTKDWGFPWSHYKILLDYAREHQIKVSGINSPNAGRDPLIARDQYFAKIIKKAQDATPEETIFALVGEYHLADEHLPYELNALDENSKILRIVNNVDDYYFQLDHSNHSNPTEFLQLKSDFFCILNSPPWIKWQSFAIWEEMRSIGFQADTQMFDTGENDYDQYNEETFDIDYQFLQMVENLSKFLEISISNDLESSFNIYTSPDDDLFNAMQEKHQLSIRNLNPVVERTSVDGLHLINESRSILLADLTLNNLAESAGQYLQCHLSNFNDHSDDPVEAFYRRVLKYAAGMVGSKILNPRRKSRDLAFYVDFNQRNQRRRLIGHAKKLREAARHIIRHQAWINQLLTSEDHVPGNFRNSIYKDDINCAYEISRAVGNMLGNALYTNIMINHQPSSALTALFSITANDRTSVWQQYIHLCEQITV